MVRKVSMLHTAITNSVVYRTWIFLPHHQWWKLFFIRSDSINERHRKTMREAVKNEANSLFSTMSIQTEMQFIPYGEDEGLFAALITIMWYFLHKKMWFRVHARLSQFNNLGRTFSLSFFYSYTLHYQHLSNIITVKLEPDSVTTRGKNFSSRQPPCNFPDTLLFEMRRKF